MISLFQWRTLSCTSEPSMCTVRQRGCCSSRPCATLNLLSPSSCWETWWTRATRAAETCTSAAALNWISWSASVCEYRPTLTALSDLTDLQSRHKMKLGLRCSTGGPEHPHVGACCGRGRERSMTCVAVHGINFTSHWTFDVNGTEVVKQSLLPVASRWRHQYCYLQTNISVQVGALM